MPLCSNVFTSPERCRVNILICRMKELLEDARTDNRAVGAFSVANMEMVMGVVKAAETLNTPVVIQVAEARLRHSPLAYIGPMMVGAAKQAAVDVCVHLDHGMTMTTLKEAKELGFTSIMFDGSAFSLEENVAKTKEVVAFARMHDLTAEAELGVVGGKEGGSVEHRAKFTEPAEAEFFVNETGIDALAVAIGNAHGHYSGEPQLDFEVLRDISQRVGTPLVLHGGSGISPAEFRKCIDLGIRKINIGTANFDAFVDAAEKYLELVPRPDYFSLNERLVHAVYEETKKCIEIFNNKEASL